MASKELSRLTITISKEELSQLPITRYEGEIVTVESDDAIAAAISDLQTADIIGFDTETKPNFRKGQMHDVALIQLATRERCYLFRICKTGFHPLIQQLLENPDIHKVGLSIHDDFHNLNRLSPFHPAGFTDLQQFVKKYGITDNSLSRIHAILFGQRISKSQQLSNWEAPELSPGQQHYAALDARACIRIYDHMTAGLFNPAESPYRRDSDA